MTYAQIVSRNKIKCGLCSKKTTNANAMRVHYHRKHRGISCFEKAEVMSRKEINRRYWEKSKAKKEEHDKEMRRKNKNVREYYDEGDAKKLGIFTTEANQSSTVSLKDSSIKNAGKGVFAETDFRLGDVITKYEGKIQKSTPSDDMKLKYTYQLKNGNYLVGITKPRESMGLGSFVNRPNRGTVANVCFFQSGQKVFIEAKQDIKKGDEILCYYGKGYIM